MKSPIVAIVMGSDSDFEFMSEAARMLRDFGVPYEMHVMSAHRSPDLVSEFSRKAQARGIRVIIAGAGGAAHLAGVVAAQTLLPVIGVPMGSALNGLDSLLSTVQMPSGVPVATVAIGKSGAANAGLLAVQILALSDGKLAHKLKLKKEEFVSAVQKKDRELAKRLKAFEAR